MSARASLGKHLDGSVMVSFRCPGCDDFHQISVGVWTFNGDLERPTFSPSVLVGGAQWGVADVFHKPNHKVAKGERTVCHSFVTGGQIQFLGDCTHTLAGQTVDLPEWSE